MPRIHSLCATILMICASALLPITSYAASPKEEVTAAYAAWDKAFKSADPKAIASFYADDAIFSGILGMGVTGHKLDLIEARGDKSLLYGTAKWSANGKDASGKDQPWGGLATHIFERQRGGVLKIKVHTFN